MLLNVQEHDGKLSSDSKHELSLNLMVNQISDAISWSHTNASAGLWPLDLNILAPRVCARARVRMWMY